MSDNPFLAAVQSGSSLEALAGFSLPELDAAVIEVAKIGISDSSILFGIRESFEKCSLDENQKSGFSSLRSFFSLILIIYYSDDPTEENRALISEIIDSDHSFSVLVRRVYEIPESIPLNELEFIDFGTTSVIVGAKAPNGDDLAIKLIKPRYWDIERVVERTRGYKAEFDGVTRRSPRVHRSCPHYIIMDRVVGVTLDVWLRSEKRLLDAAYYRKVLHIFVQLLDCLEEIAGVKHKLSHLDLNPKNIIIQSHPTRGDDIWLIDFGINYAITDSVGPRNQYAATVSAVELYVPPETLKNALTFSPLADAYSVGVLLMACLVEDELTHNALAVGLSELWQRSPGLAEFVEQLIEKQPLHRLIGCDWPVEDIFAHMSELLTESFLFFVEVELPIIKLEPRITNWWYGLLGIWTGKIGDVRLRGRTMVADGHRWGPSARYFKNWAIVAYSCYWVIISASILLTLVDLRLDEAGTLSTSARNLAALPWFDQFANWYEHQNILPVRVGDFWGNLPGRLVCVSFSIVSTRYYLRIFSLVYAKSRDDLLSRYAEHIMRLNSFSSFLAIAVALVAQPKWWPFCVFAGIVPVVFNNLLITKIATPAHSEGAPIFWSDRIQDTDRFLAEFRRWWVQMLGYGLICLVFGIFLIRGVLKDEFAYAILTILFNYFQIVRVIIAQKGYEVRAELKRLLFLDRRIFLLGVQK